MPPFVANRGDGVLELDYSTFTAGHPSNVAFGDAIDFSEPDPLVLAARIRSLAQQLVGQDVDGDGDPDWDVDNTGNGVPDSVWIDLGLPLDQSDDGKLAKPLVAILIEDLGGRVNVNLSGNLAQGRNAILRTANGVLSRLAAPTGATVAESNLPAGFGYGPAEIDIRPLFADVDFQWGNGPLNLLRKRLGSQVVGGVEYVAAGHLIDPRTNSGNDLLGVLRQPYRSNLHRPSNAHGLPVDKFGRSSIALGINGGLMVSGASAAVSNAGAAAGDSADDPYEFDLTPGGQPDNMFTVADLEAALRFDDFDRDALDSELIKLAETYFRDNPAASLRNVNDARREFAHSITTGQQQHGDGDGSAAVGVPRLVTRGQSRRVAASLVHPLQRADGGDLQSATKRASDAVVAARNPCRRETRPQSTVWQRGR